MTIAVYVGLILIVSVIGIFIAHLLSNRWIWISIVCFLISGLLSGIFQNNFWLGFLVAVLLIVTIPRLLRVHSTARNISVFFSRNSPWSGRAVVFAVISREFCQSSEDRLMVHPGLGLFVDLLHPA